MLNIKRLTPLVLITLIFANILLSQNLEDKVKVHKLKNGLTIIFVERHEAPVFSTVYAYKVGSVDEYTGITGVAHLFEHMAFKGTPKIGTSDFEKEKVIMEGTNKIGRELSLEYLKGESADKEKIRNLKEELQKMDKEQKKYIVKDEIDVIYNNAGGVGLNASTSNDMTQYYISLPANRFELFCLVESERMKNAVLREFYTERDVVQEERKQTTDAVPQNQLYELFIGAAFIAHPYNHPVVGWASDIKSVTLEEAAVFKNKYYTPNNCVLSIVGDIYPDKAIPMIEQYFGDIPAGNDPPILRTIEPKQLGERRVKMEVDAEPVMIVGYHKPTFPDRDDAVANVISSLLTMGRTSRLNKDLIKDKQLAVSINAYSGPGSRYDNVLSFLASPRYPHSNEELEAAIYGHLEKLKTEPVGEKELQKIKNNIEARYIRSMSSNMGLGITLLRYQLFFGDWKLYLKTKEILNSITSQDIMNFAKKYFTAENRTVAFLNKKVK